MPYAQAVLVPPSCYSTVKYLSIEYVHSKQKLLSVPFRMFSFRKDKTRLGWPIKQTNTHRHYKLNNHSFNTNTKFCYNYQRFTHSSPRIPCCLHPECCLWWQKETPLQSAPAVRLHTDGWKSWLSLVLRNGQGSQTTKGFKSTYRTVAWALPEVQFLLLIPHRK